MLWYLVIRSPLLFSCFDERLSLGCRENCGSRGQAERVGGGWILHRPIR